ncbi:MAG: hypothetical protein RIS35_343 [Pseudomonadota bacterium]|jgi:ABC-type uncharacterized transport system auxiliary subunit
MTRARARRPLLMALLGLALSGCASIVADAPARQWYVLRDLASSTRVSTVPIERALLVESVASSAFHDASAFAYSRAPGTRAHYQFAGWVDRPSRRIGALLERRLAERGRFVSVGHATSGLKGDLLLRLTLEDAYHDLAATPATARFVVAAELIDWRARTLIGRRLFDVRAGVDGNDAPSAAAAFDRAVTVLLGEIAEWTESAADPPPGRASGGPARGSRGAPGAIPGA